MNCDGWDGIPTGHTVTSCTTIAAFLHVTWLACYMHLCCYLQLLQDRHVGVLLAASSYTVVVQTELTLLILQDAAASSAAVSQWQPNV